MAENLHFNIKQASLSILQGDITHQATDAIGPPGSVTVHSVTQLTRSVTFAVPSQLALASRPPSGQ